jgi:hypothetical protein
MTTAKSIKSLYAIAKNAKMASEAAVNNEAISEIEFDAIIDAECEANDALIDALVNFGNGALSRDDAERVVLYKFDRMGALIARLAA